MNETVFVKGIEDEWGLYPYTKITKAKILEQRFHMIEIEIMECEDEDKVGTKLVVFASKFEPIPNEQLA